MLSKIKQVNRFYCALGVMLLVVALITIVFLRGIFDAFSVAQSLPVQDVESEIPRLDRGKLEEIYSKLYEKDPPRLDL